MKHGAREVARAFDLLEHEIEDDLKEHWKVEEENVKGTIKEMLKECRK